MKRREQKSHIIGSRNEHTRSGTNNGSDLSSYLSGESPWVALGNFMNEWFDYAIVQRAQRIADPLTLPEEPDTDALRWAAFCAASVEGSAVATRYLVHPGSTIPRTPCQNPGSTPQVPISHRYANGSFSKLLSHSPGAMSIVATACSPTRMNSSSTISTSQPPCLP